MSAVEHAARGTYKRTVHGPLPPGVVPVPRRSPIFVSPQANALPAVQVRPEEKNLTEADCPDILKTIGGEEIWNLLVRQRPVAVALRDVLTVYVQALLNWQTAVREIHSKGHYGSLGQKLVRNPYLDERKQAQDTMMQCSRLMGWQASSTPSSTVSTEPTSSRLELFLSSRRSRRS